jgi:hypothetical protein
MIMNPRNAYIYTASLFLGAMTLLVTAVLCLIASSLLKNDALLMIMAIRLSRAGLYSFLIFAAIRAFIVKDLERIEMEAILEADERMGAEKYGIAMKP